MKDVQKHLLVENSVSTSLNDWESWKERWNEELAREHPHAEVLMGLLHAVFNQFMNEELICLCLEVADGHSGRSDLRANSFFWHDRKRGRTIEWFPMLGTARKAWMELCNNVFKDTEPDGEFPSWTHLVVRPGIFHKLLWFFKVSELEWKNNVPFGHGQNHHEKLALTFLRKFIAFAWKFEPSGFDLSVRKEEMVLEMFTEARPQFVEILNRIDNLQFLLSKDVDVDERTFAKLEEIALRSRHMGKGPYHSVVEACADGSKAAETLILLKIRQEEEKRQSKIAQAERQRQEADADLAELGAGAK